MKMNLKRLETGVTSIILGNESPLWRLLHGAGAFKHGLTSYILETAANKSCIYLGTVSRNQTQEMELSKYGRHE